MDTTPTQRPSGVGADGQAVREGRPGMIGAAATTMVVFGILLILLGSLLFLAAMLFSGPAFCPACPAEQRGPSGIATGVGLLVLVVGIVEIVAARKIRSANARARLVGIVLALAAGVLGLFSIINGVAGLAQGDALSVLLSVPSIVLGLVVLVPNVFIVYALVTRGYWFAPHAA